MDQQQVFPRQPRKVVEPQPINPLQEQEEFQRARLRGQAEALQGLLSNPGWEVLSDLISQIMEEAAKEVDGSEGVSVYRAQGKKQALRELNLRVNQVVAFLKEEETDGEEEG